MKHHLLRAGLEGLPPGAPAAPARALPAAAWRLLQRALPNTMAGLIAASCMMAALPLLAALLLASTQLQRLTRHSELLIKEGISVVHLASQLHDNLTDLEHDAGAGRRRAEPSLIVAILLMRGILPSWKTNTSSPPARR